MKIIYIRISIWEKNTKGGGSSNIFVRGCACRMSKFWPSQFLYLSPFTTHQYPGGTDLERGMGNDVWPWRPPFHASPVVHKGPISSDSQFTSSPFEIIMEILAFTTSIFAKFLALKPPNLKIFSSKAPKFGNFQFTRPLFQRQWSVHKAPPPLRKSGPHTPTWKKVECPPDQYTNFIPKTPNFAQIGRFNDNLLQMASNLCKLGVFVCDENPDRYTKLCNKSTPKGRHIRIPCQCETPPPPEKHKSQTTIMRTIIIVPPAGWVGVMTYLFSLSLGQKKKGLSHELLPKTLSAMLFFFFFFLENELCGCGNSFFYKCFWPTFFFFLAALRPIFFIFFQTI